MCCSLHDLRVDVSVLLHHVFHNVWKDHEETYHYILVIWFPTHSSEHQTLLRMYTTQSDKDYNKDFLTHVTQLFSHSVFTVNAAVPARRTGIFFWSFTKKYCTTSAVCKSYRQDVFIKTLKITLWISACVCVCVVVTFWSTCAGVTFSSPLWTCDVLGWVNVVSSSSSWVRIIHRKTFLCEHNESHI